MTVDVVVLSKDRPDLFAACVAHVDAQGVPYQGWLVDNGTDGTTADIARGHGWNVLSPGRNTGFSEGNNLAVAASSGDRVLLLNNDAYLQPGALRAMLGHDDGIVGALITGSDGIVGHAGGTMYHGLPRHEGRGSRPERWACHPCIWVTFAAVVLRREVLEDCPFDEGFWYGFEDVDLCLRASAAGHRIVVCADALVVHDESQTRGRGVGDAENQARFYHKHPRDGLRVTNVRSPA